jgi:hypothetical protein
MATQLAANAVSVVVLHAAVQRLMGVVLVLLEPLRQQQQQQQRVGGLQLPDCSQDFVAGVVLHLLTTPDLVTSLPAAIKVRRNTACSAHTAIM